MPWSGLTKGFWWEKTSRVPKGGLSMMAESEPGIISPDPQEQCDGEVALV